MPSRTISVWIMDPLELRKLLWLAMNEGGDLAANDPKPDERIPIGPTDV